MQIKAVIERIQIAEYALRGLSPDQISADNDAREMELLAQARTQGLIAESDLSHYLLNHQPPRTPFIQTTAYEGGTDIHLILAIWDVIERNLKRHGVSISERPSVIATTLSAQFNALAMTDDEGSSALLFGRGVIGLGTTITLNLAPLISRHLEDGTLDVADGASVPWWVEDEAANIFATGLAELFVNFAVDGGIHMNEDWVNARGATVSGGVDNEFASLLTTGYQVFMVAHEFGHLHHGHLSEGRDGGALCVSPNPTVHAAVVERYLEIYAARHGPLEQERLRRRSYLQRREHQADLFALGVLQSFSQEYQDTPRGADGTLRAFLVGAAVFFLAMDAFEKSVYMLRYGENPEELSLVSDDYWVQNVFLRDTHPSPLSRLDWLVANLNGVGDRAHICRYSAVRSLGSTLNVFDYCWLVSRQVLGQLHAGGRRPSRLFGYPYSELDLLHRSIVQS